MTVAGIVSQEYLDAVGSGCPDVPSIEQLIQESIEQPKQETEEEKIDRIWKAIQDYSTT